MTQVRFDRRAEADIEAILRWYDRQAPGLADGFIEQLRRVVQRVAHIPLAYPMERRGVRRALLGRFPYFVLYEPLDDALVVLAVMHQRSHPDRGVHRLEGH